MTRAGVIVSLGAALMFGLLVPAGPARSAECPGDDDAPYDIDLDIDTPNARLHHDRSISELGQMTIHSPRGRILGLAKTALDFSWRVSFGAESLDEGHCVWVSGLHLTARYPTPDIYVAREYRKGSCQYRTILDHEAQHVQISKATIQRYLPRLHMLLTSLRIPTARRPVYDHEAQHVQISKATIQRYLPRLHMLLTSLRIPTARRPVYVTSTKRGKARLRALMQDLVEPVYREMAVALAKAQANLDSPASYKRYFRRCRKW